MAGISALCRTWAVPGRLVFAHDTDLTCAIQQAQLAYRSDSDATLLARAV